jgi:hypothetical protein
MSREGRGDAGDDEPHVILGGLLGTHGAPAANFYRVLLANQPSSVQADAVGRGALWQNKESRMMI